MDVRPSSWRGGELPPKMLEGGLMLKRGLLIAIAGTCVAAAVAVAGVARSASAAVAKAAPTVSCSNPIQIGLMGPFTGPVASIGDDQLHWAEYLQTTWNASLSLKINIVQGDTQLN